LGLVFGSKDSAGLVFILILGSENGNGLVTVSAILGLAAETKVSLASFFSLNTGLTIMGFVFLLKINMSFSKDFTFSVRFKKKEEIKISVTSAIDKRLKVIKTIYPPKRPMRGKRKKDIRDPKKPARENPITSLFFMVDMPIRELRDNKRRTIPIICGIRKYGMRCWNSRIPSQRINRGII
jgi:hypothetical protein